MNALGLLFAAATRRHPREPALVVDGHSESYEELFARADALARTLGETGDASPLCAVFAERSAWAYAGILGILLSGRGYVPLGPSFPAERTRAMLERAGTATVVTDRRHLDALGDSLSGFSRPLTVICPDAAAAPGWAAAAGHRLLLAPDLARAGGPTAPEGAADDGDAVSYLLFTSGTTGTPKGIGIRESNVLAYLRASAELYDLGPGDRCSQNFALTFDLSVHDMFVCWSAGACLCVPPARVAMAPASFVREQALTCWFSTPSTAVMMERLRMLAPGAFPSLRLSLFCGEALTTQTAEAWQHAAPASVVENLYGPTEATIACTAYRFRSGAPEADPIDGLVPIGRPFGGTRVAVVNGVLEPVVPGDAGELLLGGDQLAPGYWCDPERTARAFVQVPALQPPGPWYRTGDLVSLDPRGDLHYRGRVDHQIKVRGHRVELQEVEAAARVAAGTSAAIALGWPRTAAGADGTILFLAGAAVDDTTVRSALARILPGYMVPSEIHRLDSLPLNASGKVDRRRLAQIREAQDDQSARTSSGRSGPP